MYDSLRWKLSMKTKLRNGNLAMLVPVLAGNGVKICHYHFDTVSLAAYFGRIL
jgi:hypothetical protein